MGGHDRESYSCLPPPSPLSDGVLPIYPQVGADLVQVCDGCLLLPVLG